MRYTFRLLFYVKKNSPLRNGEVPVMGRITISGQRVQFSTQLSVPAELWDVQLGRAVGRGAKATAVNDRLSKIRSRVEDCYNTLLHGHKLVTPQLIKEMYFGGGHNRQMLLDFFRLHNHEFLQLVGVNRSYSTYNKYRYVCQHLENYIRGKYNRPDIAFRELDREFIAGFHTYIARELGRKQNTTWIYMIAFKHILMLARSKGYLTKDLFANYKLHSESVARNYLTEQEITKIMKVKLEDPTMRLVCDAFIFSCFTGLSYIDLRDLTRHHILEENKKLWISTKRRKTGTPVQVRIFTVAQNILQKYLQDDPSKPIFNLPSNGWCNSCLDKICSTARIDKRITFHSARHTFATTVTLSQGVAIETISKLLGHRDIQTTQIYAEVSRSHLNSEMERLSKRIQSLYGNSSPLLLPAASDADEAVSPASSDASTPEKA